MQQIVRYGTVSSINAANATVGVAFAGGGISPPLPMLSHTYRIPNIGDKVLCIYFYRGEQSDRCEGFCLGEYYNNSNKPTFNNSNIIGYDFFGEAQIQYNKSTHTLTIKAENINIEGNTTINGTVME